MKKKVLIIIGVAVLFGSYFIAAHAKDREDLSCSVDNVVYKPNDDFKPNKLYYKIIVTKNADYIPQSSPKLFFYLNSFLVDSNKKVSSLKMSYNCTGGSVPSCFLSYKGAYSNDLQVAGLNKDFSRNFFRSLDIAPEVLVFPILGSIINYTDWDSINDIEYFSKDKISPDFSVPTIWLKEPCKK